jgi:hypothetical protein
MGGEVAIGPLAALFSSSFSSLGAAFSSEKLLNTQLAL